jgi:hypothetical protein
VELIISGRRCGKTTKCLEWVMGAERTDSYPFWDRVILCFTSQEADRLRGELRRRARSLRWSDQLVSLVYNMVYSCEEWKRAQVGRHPVKVWIDNADLYLQQQFRGMVKGVTWTQREGHPEDRIKVLDDKGGSTEL